MSEPEEPLLDERPLCAACGFFNLPTERYGKHRLCRLCAATPAGSALEHPELYPEAPTLFAVCFVGNAILNQFGAFAEWKEQHELMDEEDL